MIHETVNMVNIVVLVIVYSVIFFTIIKWKNEKK